MPEPMPTDQREILKGIKRFDQLVRYLRDPMGWPVESDDFEELTFEYTPEELGIDTKNAAKIQEIKRLRPLAPNQPWGIFFVKFEPKRLPVVALRRILSQVALKKPASANKSERQAWAEDDLLFVSNYGEGEDRHISLAHFSVSNDNADLPTLKVLGWDNLDTALHLDAVAGKLTSELAWPEDDGDMEAWRRQWRSAFTLGHRETITTSQQLSERLAELARNICDRIKAALAIETEAGQLTKLMKAFQTSLVYDLNADSFADMYAQTITYGLLSARITDPKKRTVDDFAGHMRTNPFLKELMETFIKVGGRRGTAGGPGIDFDELGVSEVVELLDRANMEAVVHDFGDRNPREDPVIHFYEHFLAAYDKKQKVDRGVFYTPRPVVSYIVRSVDELLRTEFELEDGLADTATWGEMVERHKDLKIPEGASPDQAFVQILDPATGTGTFLVEVVGLIHTTMVKKWKAQGQGDKKVQALWNEYVPKHLLPRLHGYELLMAPYAIAHLKVGLKLYETGYRFEGEQRARIYLTNALEMHDDTSVTFDFAIPALSHEAAAVNAVKKDSRFTVVVGNPPYSNFGKRNRSEFILGLISSYKEGLSEKKINLDDDFIKFTRYFQHLIDLTGAGVIGLITNHTYVSGITHRKMRESLHGSFDTLRVLDLHGNQIKPEQPPAGLKDENVFDIRQGVAITLGVASHNLTHEVVRSDLWGTRLQKSKALLDGSHEFVWKKIDLEAPQFFFFSHDKSYLDEFASFKPLDEILVANSSGVQTKRDALFIGFRSEEVTSRWNRILPSGWKETDIQQEFPLHDTTGWSPTVLKGVRFDPQKVRKYTYRPFDVRYIYYDPSILGRPRYEVFQHFLAPNYGISTLRQTVDDGFRHVFCTRILCDLNLTINHHVSDRVFPLYLYDTPNELNEDGGNRNPNVSRMAIDSISAKIGLEWCNDGEGDLVNTFGPESLLYYIVAILHSRSYRTRFFDCLKYELPRIPFSVSGGSFRKLAQLGKVIFDLQTSAQTFDQRDTEQYSWVGAVPSVPVDSPSYSDSTIWIDRGKTSGVREVPEKVWCHRVGTYYVVRKWLKDRKGRSLEQYEIGELCSVVRAIAGIDDAMTDIDEVIKDGWETGFIA